MRSSGMRTSAVSQSAKNKSAVNTSDDGLYSDTDITFEETQNNSAQYTKSEIMQMKTADLQNLAAENGIEDAYEMTGSALKQVLIEKFGL